MELIVRVHGAPSNGERDPAAGPRLDDVVVAVDPSHRVGELAAALAAHHGLGPGRPVVTSHRTGSALDPDAAVGDVDLLSGDALTLAGSPMPAGTLDRPVRAVAIDVIAGPASGTSRLALPGRLLVGRSSDCDIVIDDPSVSRHHADLIVGRDLEVDVDPVEGTPNGVTVNDTEIAVPLRLDADDVVVLGGTRIAVRPFERRPDERTDRLGQIDFHRTPYRPPVVPERETEPIGPIPERPEPRKLQIFAVLAPLAAGLAMYAFTRQVQFLALTLVSPVVMVATAIEERRSGRRTFRRDLAAFRDGLGDVRFRFESLRHHERIERLRAAPDLADLVRRAELRTIDLWARGRTAPDVLTLRLGLGRASVRFPIELHHGGDDDLRAEAERAVAGLDVVDHVPVTVDLTSDAVLGIHGDAELVDGVAASLVVQASTLHSPEDLTIAAAIGDERPLDWLKWLPHVRSVASPLSGNHVTGDTEGANDLIARVLDVAGFRLADGAERVGQRVWPRVLVLLDADLEPDPAETARLLDTAPAAGVSVVWLARTAAAIPRQATRTLALELGLGAVMAGRLWSTDPAVPDVHLEVEHLRAAAADRAARALAPVRDASTASLATSIPRTAPLLDVLGVGKPTAQWVAELWARSGGQALRFPIGLGAAGEIELDLVADGPHTLVGGTSGAGKSELLQSMVASMAAHHPPTRLNFLFVDYKGGASSQVFERLPHTVGYVTNLSAELSLRALTSLRAELNRRMTVLEGRAKDLAEMMEVAPDDAPPSLVIVVDEFATLVKEVPDFVAGVVDIAQRGRSLGIHLVLATQRPSGSVDENILANTNLRISLRMLERSESTAIIDSPDAAEIPVPLRGRGLVRRGPGQLVEFQSAFAGAPMTSDDMRQPVLVGPYDRTDARPVPTADGAGTDGGPTHLTSVIDAVVEANRRLAHPAPRRPWRDVLPTVVTLDEVTTQLGDPAEPPIPGRHVVLGLLDQPERQDQRPALIDLEDGGGLLVFGSGGSGKTTLLRSIAASLHSGTGEVEPAVIVFDFASRGLASLRRLPGVVDVATGDDLEAVTRHLTVLDRELEHRRRLLADAGAEHLTAYAGDHADAPPRIVVLIDGFGGLAGTLLDPAGAIGMAAADEWADRVVRLVIDGRQVGIHTIITADRRNAVPARIHAAVANRLILRHADEMSYAEHGISGDRARGLDLPPGRGLLHGTVHLQVACVSRDPAAREQGEAIAALAHPECGRSTRIASAALPERLRRDGLAAEQRSPLAPVIGCADLDGAPVAVDLEWTNLTVFGPPRSGRSTALAATVDALLAGDVDVHAVGPAASPLGSLGLPNATFGRPGELAPALDRLANLVAMGGPVRVLLVDDADALDDPALAPIWERLAASDHLRVVAAVEQRAMVGYTTSALVNTARSARRLLALQPVDPSELLQATGVRLVTRPGLRWPPGRGVLLADRVPTVVQVVDALT